MQIFGFYGFAKLHLKEMAFTTFMNFQFHTREIIDDKEVLSPQDFLDAKFKTNHRFLAWGKNPISNTT